MSATETVPAIKYGPQTLDEWRLRAKAEQEEANRLRERDRRLERAHRDAIRSLRSEADRANTLLAAARDTLVLIRDFSAEPEIARLADAALQRKDA